MSRILLFQVHAKPVRVSSWHQRLAEGAERGRERDHGQRHDDILVDPHNGDEIMKSCDDDGDEDEGEDNNSQGKKGEKGNGRTFSPLLVVYSRPRESVIFTIKLFIMINFTLKWGLVDNINMLVQPSMWSVDRNCVIDMSLIVHHLIEKYYDDVVSVN